MAGMARAMGATLRGVQKSLGKNSLGKKKKNRLAKKILLQFLEHLFCAQYNHKLQSCINTARLRIKSRVLRQHYQAL